MKYWNTNLQKMAEYIPGEQPQNLEEYVKLNTNENPFPPSKAVLEAIKGACDETLRRYPNPTAMPVREYFAEMHSLSPEHVFVGNGSDEIFTLIFRGFIEPRQRAAFPYPSYSLYYTLSEANGIKYDKIPLTKTLDVDFGKFLEKEYALVIVANPNNPTGKGIEEKAAQAFLQKFKGLLVIDEAYVDFYGETLLHFVKEFDNCIITRSLSKSYSLAGLRVGFAIAHPDIIRGLLKLKDSYNIDRLAQVGALAALKDIKSFRYNIQMVKNNKEYLEEMLESLGFETIPSKANFVFTKHPSISSKELYERLKERKILVRWFDGPVQSEYIRISVGTMMEIKTLLKALKEILEVTHSYK